jgi:hypothetical protein
MPNNTPWKFGNTDDDEIMILDATDNYVCHVQIKQIGGGGIAAIIEDMRKEKAAFIVHAVNSHDALIKVIKDMVYWTSLDVYRRAAADQPLAGLEEVEKAFVDARALLAKDAEVE